MTLRLEQLVDVMAAQTVEAASEPEKAIWRRARACSPVLAALTAQKAEPLRGRAAEIFVERLCRAWRRCWAMMQMVRIEPRIAAEQSYWLRFFGRCGSMGGSRNAR